MSTIQDLTNKAENTKRQLHDNLDKVAQNVSSLTDANEDTRILVEQAQDFKQDAIKLKRREKFKNMRMYFLIALAIIIIIIIIAVVAVLQLKPKDKNTA